MKYIFSILLFLLSFNIKAQYNTKSIVVNSYNYNNWYQCEESGTGKASFFVAVSSNGYKARDGYYYYDIIFYNNSYYKNGAVSSTYIKNLKYYIWAGTIWQQVHYQSYILVNPANGYNNGQFKAAYVYSYNKIQKIKIVWEDVLIY